MVGSRCIGGLMGDDVTEFFAVVRLVSHSWLDLARAEVHVDLSSKTDTCDGLLCQTRILVKSRICTTTTTTSLLPRPPREWLVYLESLAQ